MRIKQNNSQGTSLIELAVVIAVILFLAGAVIVGGNGYSSWSDGKRAADALRAVDAARRLYMADNPNANVGAITQGMLLPYLPGNTWPVLPALSPSITIYFTTASEPPTLRQSGALYDPSPSTTDGVWDAGN